VTFLGHQSWAIDSGGCIVLVDPLLCDGMGEEPSPYLAIYPPRTLLESRMPSIGGVVITHEHPDHFNLPSLVKIPRTVPVWLSSNSSAAARTILSELGFTTREFAPGDQVTVAGIEFVALRPRGRTRADEWDVMPFVARDTIGHGSFFTTVDLSLDRATLQELGRIVRRPGLWAVPNNDMDLSDLYPSTPASADQTPEQAQSWARQFATVTEVWGRPLAALLYGGGFSFVGDLERLNERAFDCDSQRAIERMPPDVGAAFRHMVPGDAITCTNGEVTETERAKWVQLPPRETWLRHGASSPPREPFEFFAPDRARAPLTPSEQTTLDGLLADFCAALYGSSLFETLLRIGPRDVAPAAPTVAFVLRDFGGVGETACRVYDRRSAQFVVGDDADPTAYAASCECYARDLLDALTLERTPGYSVFGRMRFFSRISQERLDLDMALYVHLHPLRHPGQFLKIYRRQLARLGDCAPTLSASPDLERV
jgi:hypothetical protein